MISNELPGRLEALVDYMRSNKDRQISLTEVAAVTEVLIATMSGYFKSIDTSIYNEFRDLSHYIENARHEIAALSPTDIKAARIPRAGRELDAIVQATEEATNTIMEAAETIMAADPTDIEAYQAAINDKVMAIFEACSFQDITGQRISKVVETLSVIEARLHALGDVWGVDHMPPEVIASASEAASLMHGPALAGEGIDQNEVDALMSNDRSGRHSAPSEESVQVLPSEEGDRWGFGQADPIFDEAISLDADEAADPLLRDATVSEIGLSPADVERLIAGDDALEPANDFDLADGCVSVVESAADNAERAFTASNAHFDTVRTANGAASGGGIEDHPANDDAALPARAEPVIVNQARGERKTTQADIDALFS